VPYRLPSQTSKRGFRSDGLTRRGQLERLCCRISPDQRPVVIPRLRIAERITFDKPTPKENHPFCRAWLETQLAFEVGIEHALTPFRLVEARPNSLIPARG
jgi:hypothetical protein